MKECKNAEPVKQELGGDGAGWMAEMFLHVLLLQSKRWKNSQKGKK